MAEEEVKNGVYKHFKGKFYQVIGVARHSETLEEFVVYRPLYETEFGFGALFIRPKEMFLEKVLVEKGERKDYVLRFEYLENAEL